MGLPQSAYEFLDKHSTDICLTENPSTFEADDAVLSSKELVNSGTCFQNDDPLISNTNAENIESACASASNNLCNDLAGSYSGHQPPGVQFTTVQDPTSHFVQLSGVANSIGINQNGEKFLEQLVCNPVSIGTTNYTVNTNTTNTGITNATNALESMTLIEGLEVVRTSNGDVFFKPTNNVMGGLFQVPVEVVDPTKPATKIGSNDEGIYVLSVKVDNDNEEDKKSENFNEPLRTSTPNLIEDGLDETILSGNVNSQEKIVKENTHQEEVEKLVQEENSVKEKEAEVNKLKASTQEREEVEKEIESETTQNEIETTEVNKLKKYAQVNQNSPKLEEMPKEKSLAHNDDDVEKSESKKMEIKSKKGLRNDRFPKSRQIKITEKNYEFDLLEARRREKTHNLTYCAKWIENDLQSSFTDPNESVQSEQNVKQKYHYDSLLDVTSISHNVPEYKGGKHSQKKGKLAPAKSKKSDESKA